MCTILVHIILFFLGKQIRNISKQSYLELCLRSSGGGGGGGYEDGFTWATPSENVSSSMRKMCGFTSSGTCAKSHPGICSPLKYSMVCNDSVCGQQRP